MIEFFWVEVKKVETVRAYQLARYQPSCNVLVERFNQTIKLRLQKLSGCNITKIVILAEDQLPHVLAEVFLITLTQTNN